MKHDCPELLQDIGRRGQSVHLRVHKCVALATEDANQARLRPGLAPDPQRGEELQFRSRQSALAEMQLDHANIR